MSIRTFVCLSLYYHLSYSTANKSPFPQLNKCNGGINRSLCSLFSLVLQHLFHRIQYAYVMITRVHIQRASVGFKPHFAPIDLLRSLKALVLLWVKFSTGFNAELFLHLGYFFRLVKGTKVVFSELNFSHPLLHRSSTKLRAPLITPDTVPFFEFSRSYECDDVSIAHRF